MLVVLAFLKKFWMPILIVVVIIIGGLSIRSCYVNYKQRQVQEELNIERQKVIDAIVAEEAADVEGKREDAVNKGKDTNEASKELDNARNTDSSRSNTNASTVRERFCRNYPTDSLCQ